MANIVFLGPEGATFSYEAYRKLSEIFNTPRCGGKETVLVPVEANTDILPMLKNIGGHGVIAMETRAQGKITAPVESFIDLLDADVSSIHILGAIKMKLHFVLMARKGVSKENIKFVTAHPEALAACAKNIAKMGLDTRACESNGKAAEDVATKDEFQNYAALAPVSAAEKYNLNILKNCFEDEEAVTTFFLLGQSSKGRVQKSLNRVLIIFRTKDEPGALVDALIPFKINQINLIHFHASRAGNGGYDFAIEMYLRKDQFQSFQRTMEWFETAVSKCLVFGPFGIVEVR